MPYTYEVGTYLSKSLRYQHQTWYVTRKTLPHVTMCKDNFISPKIIEIKQIEFRANAKIMLYTSAGQKEIGICDQNLNECD